MFESPARKSSSQDFTIAKVFDFLDRILADAPTRSFAVQLWDGSKWQSAENPRFTLEIKSPAALRRIFWRPTELSLGEAYIFDDFDIHGDLEACFELADYLVNRDWCLSEKLQLGHQLLRLPAGKSSSGGRAAARLRGRTHSKQRDAEAIAYHYNVSNNFYRLWLDERMIYSCAYFHDVEDSLDEAQHWKLDYICRKLRLKPGERLLDIGCGWGGLIMHAAQNYQVEALGITLSQPQADLANERIKEAGLAGHCRVEVCDYRDVSESTPFDKLVSVGMFEHVGEEKLPEYFRKAYQLLKPGGVFLNHGITQSMTQVPKGPSFIDKYVFPDGELLPISTSLRFAEEADFEVRDVENLREHYALTLRHWVRRLETERKEAIRLTCPVTYRIWRIYMAGSAYGFETGRIGLCQSLLARSGQKSSGLPLTRRDWYQP